VAMGYREVWLETRRVNIIAVDFYMGHGYAERENYGVYVGRPEAVCFEKALPSDKTGTKHSAEYRDVAGNYG
ncbi:MAG TPA: hypothetical protein VLC08_00440, partial [Chitinolyticbacter sp.]|nr:hypothetical protein [Chitinolyticbacter sp.]